MIGTRIKVVVSELCPPGQIFIADPRALDTLSSHPPDLIQQVLDIARPRKLVICPSEEVAEQIREAAHGLGLIHLEDDAEPHLEDTPPDPL